MKLALVLSMLVSLVFLVGCGKSDEDVIEEVLNLQEEAVGILEKCKTADDIKAKKSELEGIRDKLKALAEDAKDRDEPSEEETKELMEKFMARMMAAHGKLQAALGVAQGDEEATKLVQEIISAK